MRAVHRVVVEEDWKDEEGKTGATDAGVDGIALHLPVVEGQKLGEAERTRTCGLATAMTAPPSTVPETSCWNDESR